ncbi:hypothetical protein NMY22_g8991 [Coprinellus aureogranulatus]|nr:hypothetical protein NMY22_g8991 [Coprinellus aureogranulatus]
MKGFTRPKGPRKERACNKFDRQGNVIDEPCTFGSRNCYYIHPDEPDWSRLEWSIKGIGWLKNTSRSRSRSRERVRDVGWDRRGLDRDRERERGGRGDRDRSRDRSRDRDWARDRDRGRPGSPRDTRRRRLSPRPPTRSPQQPRRRRSDRFSPPPPLSATSTSSRPRRDSIASSSGGDPPPTTASSAGGSNSRPRTPPQGPRALRRDSETFLLRSPEEQKPDLRELERERLLKRAELAKEQQRRRDLGIQPEVVDLTTVSGSSTSRAVSPPTAASPPPPGLASSFTLHRSRSTATPMSMSTPTPGPPPPPSEIPPPTPTDTPLSAFQLPSSAMSAMNIDSPSVLTPPVQPPPPLPDAPDFDDIEQDADLVKVTWDRRIHCLSDLFQLGNELEGMREDVETIRKLASSSTMLPDETRARYEERLKQAEERLEAKQAEYEKLRDENITSSFVWPIAKEQMERDVKLYKEYAEMVGYIANLTKVARELQKELAVLGVGKMPEVPVGEHDDAMEIDPAHPPPPPPLPYSSATPGSGSQLPPAPPLPYRPSVPPSERFLHKKDLDETLARLEAMEKEVAATQEGVQQLENELREEFRNMLESRSEELYKLLDDEGTIIEESDEEAEGEEGQEAEVDEEEEGEEKTKRRRRWEPKGDPELEELCKTAEEQTRQAQVSLDEVGTMEEIMFNYKASVDDQEKRLQTELSARQDAYTRQAELQNRVSALETKSRAQDATIETLNQSLRAHIASRPPSPPSSPSVPFPSSPMVLSMLQQALLGHLREGLRPIVEEVRNGVRQDLERQIAEVYGTVWSRVEPSVRVLGGVDRFLREGGYGEGPMVNGAASH